MRVVGWVVAVAVVEDAAEFADAVGEVGEGFVRIGVGDGEFDGVGAALEVSDCFFNDREE